MSFRNGFLALALITFSFSAFANEDLCEVRGDLVLTKGMEITCKKDFVVHDNARIILRDYQLKVHVPNGAASFAPTSIVTCYESEFQTDEVKHCGGFEIHGLTLAGNPATFNLNGRNGGGVGYLILDTDTQFEIKNPKIEFAGVADHHVEIKRAGRRISLERFLLSL